MENSHLPAPRTQLELDVDFRKSYAREESKATLKNISLTGAFLQQVEASLRSGDKVSLKFKVSGRERNIIAKVIWTNSAGCGIKFLPTNKRDTQIVDDLIYFVEEKKNSCRGVMDQIFKVAA